MTTMHKGSGGIEQRAGIPADGPHSPPPRSHQQRPDPHRGGEGEEASGAHDGHLG